MKPEFHNIRCAAPSWQHLTKIVRGSVTLRPIVLAQHVSANSHPKELACLSMSSSTHAVGTHYVLRVPPTEVWSTSFLIEVRAATKRENSAVHLSIAAACTYLLRARRAEYPELARDSSGRWRAVGLDGEVYDPMQKNGRSPSLTPSQGLWKTLAHCAALHKADAKLTAKYVCLLSSRDAKVQTELVQVVQQLEPQLVGVMMSEVFNR